MSRCAKLMQLAAAAAILCLFAAAVPAQTIKLKSVEIDPKAMPAAKAAAAPALAAGERRVEIVQWDTPVDQAKLDALAAQGAELIQPLGEYGYMVSMPGGAKLATAKTQAAPNWSSAMAASWKFHPEVSKRLAMNASGDAATTATKKPTMRYRIQLAKTGGEKAVADLLAKRGLFGAKTGDIDTVENWLVSADDDSIREISQLNPVIWIEPFREPRIASEREDLALAGKFNADRSGVVAAGAYASWLSSVGLSGNGVIVHVMDDGLSKGNATNRAGTAHPDILGRIVGIDNATYDDNGESGGGHGHLNAAIIMGQPISGGGMADKDGYKLGQGVAPNAQVYATKIFNNYDQWNAYKMTETDMVGNAAMAGAVISSNSWGASVAGEYDSESQLYDKLTRDANAYLPQPQPMAFFFAASNEGPNPNTVGSPGTAKNVVCVGANENSDAGILDKSGIGPSLSNDMRDVAEFSSRGPLADGRLAPTVVANGTHVPAAASDSPNFNGYGVSGRHVSALDPGEPLSNSRYYPANQFSYTRSSGTSHSCPLVAGAAALFYEFYKKTYGTGPSPAMIKAALVAGAVDPVGGNNNRDGGRLPNIPNNEVGWGFATLGGIVDKTKALFVYDQSTVLTVSGQEWSQDIQVSDSSKPLRIVVAWTDVPAYAGLSKALINDLDLTVSDGKATYKGNVFSNGQSIEGGTADRLNNVECVFLPHPVPSVYTIKVTARSISGDARPGTGGALEQDFALIATNGSSQSPIGRVAFNSTRYNCGDTAEIGVSDADLKGAGTITVTLTSQKTADSETVALTEVKAPSGVLRGSIGFNTATAVKNNGVLSVRDGDTIRATYKDATTGSGGTPLVATSDAVLDCVAPRIANVAFSNVTDETAEITVSADEAAQFSIVYGTAGNETARQISTLNMETSHKFTLEGLTENTAYFFKVQMIDLAGNTRVGDDGGNYFAFQTPKRMHVLKDNMESGAMNWAHGASRGADDWKIVATTHCKSESRAWMVSEPDSIKDAYLYTNLLTLPANSRLEFWHTFKFEHAGLSVGWDGGVLEITRDGGATWEDLGPYMIEGGYNYLISTVYGNPLGGRMAWSGGSLDAMTRVLVDLSAFGGEQVRLRWRIGCDSDFASEGWYIDDVDLYALGDGTGPLAVLKFDNENFTCAQEKLHFTVRDQQFSTDSDGLTPSDFYLSVPGRVAAFSIAPSGLNLTPASEMHDVWQGDLTVSAGTKSGHRLINGVLDVAEGESVRLIYVDSKTGSSPASAGDSSLLDCTAPQLVSFDEKQITDTEASFDMTVSEPSLITIKYGATPDGLNMTFKTNTYVASQEVTFRNLLACRPCYYTIQLADPAGNTTFLDNLGEPFGFRTMLQSTNLDTLDPQPKTGWTHKALSGTDNWKYTIATASWCSGYARTLPNAWNSASVASLNDNCVMMPPATITPVMFMTFWHTYELENSYDGARIEISIDGGVNWKDLGANIVQGQYTGVINSDYGSPIANQSAWTGGKLGQMTQVIVDLGKYAGSNRLIRFRQVCDRTNMAKGWIIDDVSLTSYNTCGTQFPGVPTNTSPANNTIGFAYTGGTLRWSAATGATKYEVFVGRTASTLQSLGEVSTTSFTISSALKAGINQYWCVRALNTTGAGKPSATWKFKTTTVDPTKVAKYIVGSGSLSAAEKSAVDYNDDGKVLVNELVTDINGK